MLPHFDWSISLGSLLTILGFLGSFWLAASKMYLRIDRRIVTFELLLAQHAETLVKNAAHVEKQDELLLRLVGDLQRLVGRIEGTSQNLVAAEVTARGLIASAAVTAQELLTATAQAAKEKIHGSA